MTKEEQKAMLIRELVDDIGWEYDRMSVSGKETYVKLCKLLGWKYDTGEDNE